MNPHIINLLIKGHQEKIKIKMQVQDTLNWYMGQYAMSALDSTICNGWPWRKAGSQPHSYIKKPLLQEAEKKNTQMTEDEIQKQRELFITRMKTMQANFELNRKNEAENQGIAGKGIV